MINQSRFRYRARGYAAQLLLLGLLPLVVGGAARATEVMGSVKDTAGKPVAGYMLSIDNGDVQPGDVTLTVFTDQAGQFRTPNLGGDASAFVVRGGTPGLVIRGAAPTVPLSAGKAQGGNIRLDLVVEPGNTPDLLPASSWLSQAPDGHGRNLLVLHCTACHQMPTPKIKSFAHNLAALDRTQRVQAWRAMVQYMRIKVFEIGPEGSLINPVNVPFEVMSDPQNSLFNESDEAVIADFMAEHLPTEFAKDADYSSFQGASAVTAGTLIREIHLPKTSLVREIALTPKSPYLWGADLQKNRLLRVDPADPQKQVAYPVPFDKPTGPHTLVDDAEGYIWDGNVEGDVVFRFNPLSDEWQGYNFGPGSVVHDFALDSKFRVARDLNGRLWLTLIGKNKLGRLDTATGEVVEFDVPMDADNKPFRAAIYGAIMTSDKKRVWFSQLTGGVGALDTETGKLVHWIDYPLGEGPRRMAIDDHDTLYVPLFGSGELSIVDTSTGKETKRVALPDRASAPYSAVWDQWRNLVWLGTSNADLVYRYDVASGKVSHIPLPSRLGYLRMITFDRTNGNLWTAYSNMPAGSGPSAFVMIDPGDKPAIPGKVASR